MSINSSVNQNSRRDDEREITNFNNSRYFYRASNNNPFRDPFFLNGPIGVTHYDETFFKKPYSKPNLIRSGSATGNRNNQPQPTQDFITWRYKPPRPELQERELFDFNEEKLREVIKRQMQSVYSVEISDPMNRGVMNNGANNSGDSNSASSDKKKNIYCTETKEKFIQPIQSNILRNTTSRFGCTKPHTQDHVGRVLNSSLRHYKD